MGWPKEFLLFVYITSNYKKAKAGTPLKCSGAPSKGSTFVNKFDAMVIAELKQKYSNLKAGTSSTDDTIPKAVATSSNDNTTNDGFCH